MGNWERLVIVEVSEGGLWSTQKATYNETSDDAPPDNRLVYQDVRQGNDSDHLLFWAATLGPEKVRNTMRCPSELEMADIRYVAIFVREGVRSTAIVMGNVLVDYLGKVERAVERGKELGHGSLWSEFAISRRFAGFIYRLRCAIFGQR